MRPIPPAPRLLPLLAGSAAGSLGPEDLAEIGISVAAVDIVELAVGLGLDRVERLGGLARLTGWEGPLVAVARTGSGPPAATGWRARALPEVLSESDGILELRSALDGSTISLARQELADWASRLGAEPATSVAGGRRRGPGVGGQRATVGGAVGERPGPGARPRRTLLGWLRVGRAGDRRGSRLAGRRLRMAAPAPSPKITHVARSL